MVAMDELLARNAAFAATVPADVQSGRPRLRLAVVTCMDVRIDVFPALGMRAGDAHVLRNAGGIVTDDMLRSLVLSQHLLDTVEIMVIQHTNCGLHGLHDGDLVERLTAETGETPPFSFGGFDDLDASVQRSLERLRRCPWLVTTDYVRGYVYETDTGKLREVVAS